MAHFTGRLVFEVKTQILGSYIDFLSKIQYNSEIEVPFL